MEEQASAFISVGHHTSVDVARDRSYTSTTVSGVKRTSAGAVANSSLAVTSPYEFRRPTLNPDFGDNLTASAIRCVGDPPADRLEGPSAYTQRNALASTPGPTQNPLLTLSHRHYGLPDSLTSNFASLGVNSIYPWQSACLLGKGILSGEQNLVYTAPTGGGKSLVADVLMLKKVIDNPGKKGILVLPYVALVQEKLKWLRRLVHGVERRVEVSQNSQSSTARAKSVPVCTIRVVGYHGGGKTNPSWADVDIAVCTIEKANSLINSAIEEETVDTLGAIVLDELHMIDDEHRGYQIELIATKLLCVSRDIQIIGMSATLSNTQLLAKWLDAKYYESKYRPIPIEEYLVFDGEVYSTKLPGTFIDTATQFDKKDELARKRPEKIRQVESSQHKQLRDPLLNAVVALAIETVRAGYGVLVFCSSRNGCEQNANLLASAMPDVSTLSEEVRSARQDVIAELSNTVTGFEPIMEALISRGVGFHHAGMTTEEREIISEAYDRGYLKIIVATCSLAAGINLPARRVILHGARMGRDMIGPAMLRQMRGRAGRKGKDEVGESYLCCAKNDLVEVTQLLEADLPVVQSSLTAAKRGISRALLEVIATRLATSEDSINDYIRRSLLFHTSDPAALPDLVHSTLNHLIQGELILIAPNGQHQATLLGQAIVASSLTPEDGLFVHAEIQRALRAFVMDGELHLFYLFTPVQTSSLATPNWPIFQRELENLDDSGRRVLDFIGVSHAQVNRLAAGGSLPTSNSPSDQDRRRTYARVYAAFMLRDLSNEMPIPAVAAKYASPRGAVQTLATTCHSFAAGMIRFCERLARPAPSAAGPGAPVLQGGNPGYAILACVLEHARDRLRAGARADLLELAQIPFVKSRTARVFWENGLRTVRAVAEARVDEEVLPVLMLALRGKRKRVGWTEEDERRFVEKVRAKAEVVVGAAERIWRAGLRVEIED